ncbi:connective tissue growth factor precursor, partial [Silurus asotus]
CAVMCARQRGEPCSHTEPCQKGLRCRYTGGTRNRPGLCAPPDAEACVLGKSVYHNGETFFPSCSYQCVCHGGQVSCVPRCNLDVMLPSPECPFPRKVQVPGECCEKWVCDAQAEVSMLGGFAMAVPYCNLFCAFLQISAYRQEETVGFDPTMECIEQTTEWSACSRSCGMGVSTRVTNQNRRCEMVKQNRLCMVRPCHTLKEQVDPQESGTCLEVTPSSKPVHFTFRNCSSVQAFRPRFCGQCSDDRCCTPHATKTAPVTFSCPNGSTLKRLFMFIRTCVCHRNCPAKNGSKHRPEI